MIGNPKGRPEGNLRGGTSSGVTLPSGSGSGVGAPARGTTSPKLGMDTAGAIPAVGGIGVPATIRRLRATIEAKIVETMAGKCILLGQRVQSGYVVVSGMNVLE